MVNSTMETKTRTRCTVSASVTRTSGSNARAPPELTAGIASALTVSVSGAAEPTSRRFPRDPPSRGHWLAQPLGLTGNVPGGCAACEPLPWVCQRLLNATESRTSSCLVGQDTAGQYRAVLPCPAPLLHQGRGEGLVMSPVMSGATGIGDIMG